VTHTSLLQHPSGQEVGSQTHLPAGPHSCPVWHATHAPPALPQAADVGVRQPPSAAQHPLVQACPLQLQLPPMQAEPGRQTTQAAPPVPHAAVVGVETQCPVESQQPCGQGSAHPIALVLASPASLASP
jgi:hypothetical protein